jgi:hypothetical protein
MHRRALCICAVLLPLALPVQSQPARASAVKAAFIFKFPAYVEWPAGTFQRPDQPLVIGVMGDDDVAADLEQIAAGRSVDGHPVTVQKLPETAHPAGVHVLYVGAQLAAKLREIVEATQGPVLVVTDQPTGLRAGSVLNFAEEAGRIRFSASLASADARNLKLSSRLLEVARNVEGRPR